MHERVEGVERVERDGVLFRREGGFFGSLRQRREKEVFDSEHAEILNQQNLIPILRWAYGEKDWNSRTGKYWEQEEWNFVPGAKDLKSSLSEEVLVTYEQLRSILSWSAHPDSFGHLEPPSGIVYHLDHQRGTWLSETGQEKKGFSRGEAEMQIDNKGHEIAYDYKSDQAVAKTAKYYFNSGFPEKITPLIAKGASGDIRAVLTIRWRGDPFIPRSSSRTAGIEAIVVDPAHKHEGIGTKLTSTAIERAFEIGYDGKGAEKVRAWIMQDKMAGDWQPNWFFFRKLGFEGNKGHWPEYARERGLETDRGDATWFELKPEAYALAKELNPEIKPYEIR